MKSPSGTESAIAASGGGNAARAVSAGLRPMTITATTIVATTSSAPPRRSRLRRTPGSSLLAPGLAFIRPIGLAAFAKRSDVCDQLFDLVVRQRSSEAGHERTFAEHDATSVDAIVQPIVGPR